MKLNPDCIRDVLLYLEEHLHIKDRNKLSKIDLKELKEKLNITKTIFFTVSSIFTKLDLLKVGLTIQAIGRCSFVK